MIESATYTDGDRTATLSVERIDTWQEDTEVILNFPHVVELADNCLFMRFSRSQHAIADVEPKRDVFSTDDGETWGEPPPNMDFGGGSLGYLRDGTIMRLEHNTVEANRRTWDKHVGPFHLVMQEDDPTFRLGTWRSNGDPIDSTEFKIDGLPWETASYQTYAKILDLDDGSLLAAMEAQVGPPRKTDQIRDDGRHRWEITMTTFIVRSRDRGQTWDFVTAFRPEELNLVYGGGDRPVDEGLTEADLVVAANGDILCVNRTGSYSPMWQTRSTDGGHTWGTPHPVGWQGVKPRLNLLPNGVLTCAAGRGGYGHPQVTHVMVSLDGTGNHWEAPFCFHTGPGCSYTSTMVRDGKLHVVFSDSDFTRPFGTHNLPSQRIRRAVIDVRLHDS